MFVVKFAQCPELNIVCGIYIMLAGFCMFSYFLYQWIRTKRIEKGAKVDFVINAVTEALKRNPKLEDDIVRILGGVPGKDKLGDENWLREYLHLLNKKRWYDSRRIVKAGRL